MSWVLQIIVEDLCRDAAVTNHGHPDEWPLGTLLRKESEISELERIAR